MEAKEIRKGLGSTQICKIIKNGGFVREEDNDLWRRSSIDEEMHSPLENVQWKTSKFGKVHIEKHKVGLTRASETLAEMSERYKSILVAKGYVQNHAKD